MLEDAGRQSLDGLPSALGKGGTIVRAVDLHAPPHAVRAEDRASADATRIVSAFAHDIRQPLTSIRMNVQTAIRLLRGRPSRTSQAIAALQDTLAAEGAATEIVLATSARVAGLPALARSVDLNAVVVEVHRRLRAVTATWGDRLELDLDREALFVDADPQWLRCTVSKLVLSAFDTMDANETMARGRLSLRTRRGEGRFAELRLQGVVPESLGANRDFWTRALGGAASHAQECYTIVESLSTGLTVRVVLPVTGNGEGARESDGRG